MRVGNDRLVSSHFSLEWCTLGVHESVLLSRPADNPSFRTDT